MNLPCWGIVLDMDDTLYLERDYVRSGFDAVAARLVKDGLDADVASAFLWERFVAGKRGDHFGELLVEHGSRLSDERPTSELVADLVTVYRGHEPVIELLPGMRELLVELRAAGHQLALISDGALASQQAKVKALGVDDLVAGPLVLTDVWGRDYWKPHPRGFEEVQRSLDIPPERLVYIGDNPRKDFGAPRALGWWCVRLRLPEQLHHAVDDTIEPDLTLTSIDGLRDALAVLTA